MYEIEGKTKLHFSESLRASMAGSFWLPILLLLKKSMIVQKGL